MAAAIALSGIGCAPGAACTLAKIEEWPIRWVAGHYAVVDGTLNGQPIGILVDTGATRSLILSSAARRLDLPRRQTRRYRMFGIGGESPVEIAYIQSFSIGKAVRQDWELIVAGAREFAPGIDVILGEDFFHKADVEFDLARSVVRLLEAKDCGDASLAYWTTEVTAEVAIEAVDEAAPQIIVPVKVNGHPMRALLDSGAPHSILTKRDAAAAGLTSSTPGAFLVGRSGGLGAQSVEMWVGPIDSFTIGNENIRDTTLHFGDLFKDVMVTETGTHVRRQIAGLPQMLLGIDFIRAHRVLVAHSQHKMYFSYVGGPTFQQPRPRPPQSVPPQSVPPPGASPPGAQGAKDREDSAPSGG